MKKTTCLEGKPQAREKRSNTLRTQDIANGIRGQERLARIPKPAVVDTETGVTKGGPQFESEWILSSTFPYGEDCRRLDEDSILDDVRSGKYMITITPARSFSSRGYRGTCYIKFRGGLLSRGCLY